MSCGDPVAALVAAEQAAFELRTDDARAALEAAEATFDLQQHRMMMKWNSIIIRIHRRHRRLVPVLLHHRHQNLYRQMSCRRHQKHRHQRSILPRICMAT